MTDNDPHLANGLLPGILTGLLATVAGAAGYGALNRRSAGTGSASPPSASVSSSASP